MSGLVLTGKPVKGWEVQEGCLSGVTQPTSVELALEPGAQAGFLAFLKASLAR